MMIEYGIGVLLMTLVGLCMGYRFGYKYGHKDGKRDGYLRGYRDAMHGRTFKRDQETY